MIGELSAKLTSMVVGSYGMLVDVTIHKAQEKVVVLKTSDESCYV